MVENNLTKQLFLIMAVSLLLGCSESLDIKFEQIQKSRIIVLTDMLNEPDDSQTMVRLLMYSNMFDIEGLIAVSSCHQYKGKNDPNPVRNTVHPEEIKKFINAYAEVIGNLKVHADDWPEPDYLFSKIGEGPVEFGMKGVGEGKSTSGSELIIEALMNDDPRPLYVCINAGASCLAQALFDMNNQLSKDEFIEKVKKLRVYDDAGQDDAGAWIANKFPEIHYQRSQSQVFDFYSNDGPFTWDTTFYPGEGQHKWANENVQTGHGPLGEIYPTRMRYLYPDKFSTLEGGGTSTWIGHANRGLYVPEEMTWGGWGGRFEAEKVLNPVADGQLRWAGLEGSEEPYKPFYMYPQAVDKWTDPETGITYNDAGTAISRWRRGYQNDFEGRMDWCITQFDGANHNPVAAFYEDLSDDIVLMSVSPGSRIILDATKSEDPDGDGLSFRWFLYPEAGSYNGNIDINYFRSMLAEFTVPMDSQGSEFHIILEVKDDNEIVSMYDYRRIVFNVK